MTSLCYFEIPKKIDLLNDDIRDLNKIPQRRYLKPKTKEHREVNEKFDKLRDVILKMMKQRDDLIDISRDPYKGMKMILDRDLEKHPVGLVADMIILRCNAMMLSVMARKLTYDVMMCDIERKHKVLHGMLLTKSEDYAKMSSDFTVGYRQLNLWLLQYNVAKVTVEIIGQYY